MPHFRQNSESGKNVLPQLQEVVLDDDKPAWRCKAAAAVEPAGDLGIDDGPAAESPKPTGDLGLDDDDDGPPS